MPRLESRIVILGASGMLGHALQREFPGAVLLDNRLTSPRIDMVDITSIDCLRDKIGFLERGDWVINSSAVTGVDFAETEEGSALSHNVNVGGPANLAQLAVEQGFGIVHYSTDFIFDGRQGNYRETNEPNPLNNYGRHKLEGEQPVLEAGGIVLRTAYLYGPNGSSSFVDRVIELARANPQREFVNDQIGSPTFTQDLVKITSYVINNGGIGPEIYHTVNDGKASRADLAREVVKILGIRCEVADTTTEAYNKRFREGMPTAIRPFDSSLSTAKLRLTGYAPREWKAALRDYLSARR